MVDVARLPRCSCHFRGFHMKTADNVVTAQLQRGKGLARRTVFATIAGAAAFAMAACGPSDASPGDDTDLHMERNKPTVSAPPR